MRLVVLCVLAVLVSSCGERSERSTGQAPTPEEIGEQKIEQALSWTPDQCIGERERELARTLLQDETVRSYFRQNEFEAFQITNDVCVQVVLAGEVVDEDRLSFVLAAYPATYATLENSARRNNASVSLLYAAATLETYGG
ncbi:MAG TPA: hypothetical protein VEB18_03185 [Candidatus Paceibacterota bacterium]|nr:hypothetical protein [Candidatus Paceibacterota bacterium]